MFKSIIAVVVPIVIWGLLWVTGNSVGGAILPDSYNEAGVPQSAGVLVGFVAYSICLSLMAGFICSRLAPQKQMKHVLILGAIQLLIGIGVQSSVWTQMPLWYHLIFLACVVPAHLAGGRLAANGNEYQMKPV